MDNAYIYILIYINMGGGGGGGLEEEILNKVNMNQRSGSDISHTNITECYTDTDAYTSSKSSTYPENVTICWTIVVRMIVDS